ncbi:hypothetical protein Tco_1198924, partial [Tanacetum coccineum]
MSGLEAACFVLDNSTPFISLVSKNPFSSNHPLAFCPQWKYLVHVLLHCLSPKSTSWEQFGTNIASALVRSIVFEQAVRRSRQTSGLYTIRFSSFQGTDDPHDAASIPKSPNDYTPTDVSQTSGGDEGLLDVYALNREVRRLKKHTLSQAKQILKLKAKLKKLSKFVQPVVKHHALWVENQNLKKQKRRRKKHKKKVSSVKLGRNKDEGILSEEH